MNLTNILSANHIFLDTEVRTKNELFRKFVVEVFPTAQVELKEEIFKELLHREEISGTYLGGGAALPHARCNGLTGYYLAVFQSFKGINFGNSHSVRLIFILAGPRNDATGYIKYIMSISRILKDEDTRQTLMTADNAEKVLSVIG